MVNKLVSLSIIFLVACSSPPKAPQVNWSGKSGPMNSQIAYWQPTFSIIKADTVTSTWEKMIRNFIPENRLYDDAVFYAIAHSDTIIIETNNNDVDYLTTKNWLKSHGAYGQIQFKNRKDCVTCRSTHIYLIKKGL